MNNVRMILAASALAIAVGAGATTAFAWPGDPIIKPPGPACDPQAYPQCNQVDGDSCSVNGAVSQCWVNAYACEPGICYCDGNTQSCF